MELSTEQLESIVGYGLKGRTVNNVTHDLNNLLGAIMAYAELIDMDSDDPEAKRMLGEIVRAVDMGADMLSALTNITRAPSTDALVLCDVSEILDSLGLLFAYEYRMGRTDVECGCDEAVANAKMDGGLLQASLMYVVDNALEAIADANTQWLNIRASLERGNVCIVISDSGSGVESSVIERMFEPGFTTKGEGRLGMGLHMARRNLEKSGGSIDYEQGTGFSVLVPKAE